MTQNKLTSVSLFSGAGGMDLGFERAGFKTLWANDRDHWSCETHELNFPGVPVVEGKIQDVDFSDVPQEPSAVTGGYPCQGFSVAGARNPGDSRNALYKQFRRAIGALRPLSFVAENVKGLLTMCGGGVVDAMVESFASEGYAVKTELLNAADYGVPQWRERVFIVGTRDDLGVEYEFPRPSHDRDPPEGSGLLPWNSVERAMHLLPEPRGGDVCRDDYTSRFMSRQRKRQELPAYTVVAQAKNVTLHPSGQKMAKAGRDEWEFAGERNRRLSSFECQVLQSFPTAFEFAGDLSSRHSQIGNAVPPVLAQAVATTLAEALDRA